MQPPAANPDIGTDSQAFKLLVDRESPPPLPRMEPGGGGGMRVLARHPRPAGVSSGFGVVMGIIPGVGEFLAQFFSYTFAGILPATNCAQPSDSTTFWRCEPVACARVPVAVPG